MTDPHISFRKPNCIIHADETSWSGKYYIYLGHHYESGHECWVVGAYNIVTDVRTERHYNSVNGSRDPKADALIYWEPFLTKMQQAPESEEPSEFELELKTFMENEGRKKGIGDVRNPFTN